MKEIAIIMGSDSDLPVMKDAAEFLDEMGVGYDLTIVSAHRTPARLCEFARAASEKGYGVIIAGAGGAAHLPGMTASMTTLPVIGVPIMTKALSGVDSLYSIVSMPAGIPVATVAINGAKNAGILACRILAINDAGLRKKLGDYAAKLEADTLKKALKLEAEGYKAYLKQQ